MHFDNKMVPDRFMRVKFGLYAKNKTYVKAGIAEPCTDRWMWLDLYRFQRCGLIKPEPIKCDPGIQSGWVLVDVDGLGKKYYRWIKYRPMSLDGVECLCNMPMSLDDVECLCSKKAVVPMEIENAKKSTKRTNRCRGPISHGLFLRQSIKPLRLSPYNYFHVCCITAATNIKFLHASSKFDFHGCW